MTLTSPLSLTVIDAAHAVGDAVMSAASLRGHRVTAASRTPEAVTRFSPTLTIHPHPLHDIREFPALVQDADAVVLTLGSAHAPEEQLVVDTVRTLRSYPRSRLVVTAPLDAVRISPQGAKETFGPRRHRGLREALSPRTQEMLATRRAIELLRGSAFPYVLLLHPRIIVAPGPAEVTRVPAAHAPVASRDISAANVAAEVLMSVEAPHPLPGEFVVSE